MQYKAATFELKKLPDEDGLFEGYASVFNVVDNGMDVVARGAFMKSLGSRKVKMLWQHDTTKVIGVWDEIAEDERGLRVKGRILKDVQQGREAMALLRAGALDSMSIGYSVKAASEQGNGSIRQLDEIDLYEISLVTFPMLDAAKVTDVKSVQTIRQFEKFLRDAGLSKAEATAAAAHGFKGLTDQRDAVEDEAETEGLDDLLAMLNQLQENMTNG